MNGESDQKTALTMANSRVELPTGEKERVSKLRTRENSFLTNFTIFSFKNFSL